MKEKIKMFIDFSGLDSYIAGEKVLLHLQKKGFPLSLITFCSYQAYPAKDNYNKNFLLNQSRLYNWSIPRTRERYNDFVSQGKLLGIHVSLKKIIDVNSRNAHIGFQYAKAHHKEIEYFEATMAAIFVEGKNLSLIEEVGNILQILQLNKKDFFSHINFFDKKITEDMLYAARLNVNEAPTFIKNEKAIFTGIPDEDILDKLFFH